MELPSYYSRSPIQVSIRIKPLDPLQPDSVCLSLDPQTPKTLFLGDPPKPFTFDHVFDSTAPQPALFETLAEPLIGSCLQGYNVCIFAYGQTGAGKTYTIMGNNDSPDEKGLIPRTIDHLFSRIEEDISNYTVKVSFLEIYNEQIIDLLDNGKKTGLLLREDLKKGVYVENLTEEPTKDSSEAEALLRKGSRIRHIGATNMNRESSRSHSVFTVSLETKSFINGVLNVRCSKLSFVDLAGSERQKNLSVVSGDRLKEGCNINRSLYVLGKVINGLSDGRNRHIHYRDSKLTFLLKDSLGGNSKTSLIANINPAQKYYQETVSTVKFAKRAKMIRNRAVVNEEHSGDIESLKQEIRRLKQELLDVPHSLATGAKPDLLIWKQFMESSLDTQNLLQEELGRTNEGYKGSMEKLRELKGMEEEYRMVIELLQERIRRKEKGDIDGVLARENEALRNLTKRMPFLVRLHQENLRLKEEMAFFTEPRNLQEEVIGSLQRNFGLLKEVKMVLESTAKEGEEQQKNDGKNEAYEKLLSEYKEKVELLTLELMESKPHNESMSHKILEGQETLDSAYERISELEKELEDVRQRSYEENEDLMRRIEELEREKDRGIEEEIPGESALRREIEVLREGFALEREELEARIREMEDAERRIREEWKMKETNGDDNEKRGRLEEENKRLNVVLEEKERLYENELKNQEEKNKEIEEKDKELEERNNELEEKKKEIEERNKDLEEKLEDLKNINEDLLRNLEMKSGDIEEIQRRYSILLEENSGLVRQNEVASNKVMKQEIDLEEAMKENQDLKSEIANLKNDLGELRNQKDEAVIEDSLEIHQLETELNSLKEAHEGVLMKSHQKDLTLNEKSNEIEVLKAKNCDFEIVNSQQMEEIVILKEKFEAVYLEKNKEIAVLNQEINKKEVLIQEKITEVEISRQNLRKNENLAVELENELKTSREKLKDHDHMSQELLILQQTINALNEKVNFTESLLLPAQQENSRLEDRVKSLENAKDQLMKSLFSLEETHATLHETGLSLQEANQNLKDSLISNELQISQLLNEISQLKNYINELEAMNEKNETSKDDLMNSNENLKSQLRFLSETNAKIQESILDLENQHSATQETNKSLSLDIKHTKNELEEKQKLIIKQEEAYSSLQTSFESLKSSLSQSQQECQLLSSRIRDLQSKNRDKDTELHASQEHISSLEKAHEDLLRSVNSLTMDQGLAAEKFEALQKAHEALQNRFDNQEQSFNRKASKLQKDLEIKAGNSQELLRKIETLKEEAEKIKRKAEKQVEEMEIKHSEEIKTLYDERRLQLEKLVKEKEELNEEEIEKYKKLIGNLKKQVIKRF